MHAWSSVERFGQVGRGCVQSVGTSSSWTISRWQDQTILMASGVPMPAPRGSPAGPNHCEKEATGSGSFS